MGIKCGGLTTPSGGLEIRFIGKILMKREIVMKLL